MSPDDSIIRIDESSGFGGCAHRADNDVYEGDRARPDGGPPWHGDPVNCLCRGSADRECESPHARIGKLDLELSGGDVPGLPDQLIQPLFDNRALPLVVDVAPVSRARLLSVDEHAK